MKTTINSDWIGTWIMLHERTLYYYNELEQHYVIIDLRKVRCIIVKEKHDFKKTLQNLYVENGPIISFDCPQSTFYSLIMCNAEETKTWANILKEETSKSGPTLGEMQLTNDNVPILVEKCLNFIYAYGSLKEGLFKKSGSVSRIQKLINEFKNDPFNTQINKKEYSIADVTSTLKRFFKKLPEPLLEQFKPIVLSKIEMNRKEKINTYEEILMTLDTFEYCSLKKLLGLLHFVKNLSDFNKIGIEQLSSIWAPILFQCEDIQYDLKQCEIVTDLIFHYKDLFDLTIEEMVSYF